MKYKLKNIATQILSIVLCAVFLSNILFSSVSYATSGSIVEEFIENILWHDPFGKGHESIEYLLEYYLAQLGVIQNGTYDELIDNTEDYYDNIKNVWTPENIQIKTGDNGKKSLVFNKVVADALLDGLKEVGKKPDNGGYELVKTIPVSKISRLYFNTNEEYYTFLNLLKDNNGIIGFKMANNKIASYYKIDSDYFWVKTNSSVVFNGINYNYCSLHSSLSTNGVTYYPFVLNDNNVTADNWNDTENLVKYNSNYASMFLFYNYFSAVKDNLNGKNPFSLETYVVTSSGMTVPVFNSLNDAVDFSIANRLYYTSSAFTGEGQEITIDYDELDKILSGYYSGMYDMLQKLIEQSGGNSLTPEQLQELVDKVIAGMKEGFGDISDSIDDSKGILQGIKNTLDEILKYVKKIRFWAAADTVVDGIDLIADLVKFVKDFLSDVTVGVASLATGFTDIVNLVSQKFPFSIPWDIAFFVSSFADTPEAPVFELPLKLPRYGIDEKLVIDFSRFEVISKISRSMLTVIYAMGLLKFTDKIISNKKGGAV